MRIKSGQRQSLGELSDEDVASEQVVFDQDGVDEVSVLGVQCLRFSVDASL